MCNCFSLREAVSKCFSMCLLKYAYIRTYINLSHVYKEHMLHWYDERAFFLSSAEEQYASQMCVSASWTNFLFL